MTGLVRPKRIPALTIALTAMLGGVTAGPTAGAVASEAARLQTSCHARVGAWQDVCRPGMSHSDCRMCNVVPPSGLILAASNGVSVAEAWARASPGAASNGAAYVTLVGGAEPDQLIGVTTPVAAVAEVHETTNENGIMKMRPVPAISIPAGQTVTLAPGGYHIMLMGLKQPLVAGQRFPITLAFAHGAQVTLDVQVQARGAHDQMPMK